VDSQTGDEIKITEEPLVILAIIALIEIAPSLRILDFLRE